MDTRETDKLPASTVEPQSSSYLDYWIVAFILLITVAVPILVIISTAGTGPNIWTMTFNNIFSIIVLVLIPVFSLFGIVWSFRVFKDGKSYYCIKAVLALRYGVLASFFLLFPFLYLSIWTSTWSGLATQISSLLSTIPEDRKMYGFVYTLMYGIVIWSILLPITFYGLQLVRLGVKEKIIEPRRAVFHIIAQFIPFLGTIVTTNSIMHKWEDYRKSTLFLLIISLLVYDPLLTYFIFNGINVLI